MNADKEREEIREQLVLAIAERDAAEAETSRILDLSGKEIAALKAEVERLRVSCADHQRVRENHCAANRQAQEECMALRAEVERMREAMREAIRVVKHKLVQARMEERADRIKELIGHAEYSLSEAQP